jgi:xanthine/CO dehydrogenase XdhC/CoxF family maturation factor
MKDDGLILSAWAEAVRQGVPAILATVVKVNGSSYRSPGARMLITETGGRTGSISGGCLEGDVLKKAWWLTGERPAAMRVYDDTSDDDAVWQFGLGCNGIVHVLLERWEAGAEPVTVDLLRACREDRRGGVLATVISGDRIGRKLAIFPDGSVRSEIPELLAPAQDVFRSRESEIRNCAGEEVFFEYIAPPVPLLIVGAGHDAVPVVRLAKELGWHVTVADGRSNHARPERFPEADRVLVTDTAHPLSDLVIDERTVAVLMSHSYPQASAFLKALDPLPVRYLGVLGPRKRTERMLSEAGLEARPDLHSPVGLDIGADTPEEIALAIVSEIQATLTGRSGGMLLHRAGPIHERAEPVPA